MWLVGEKGGERFSGKREGWELCDSIPERRLATGIKYQSLGQHLHEPAGVLQRVPSVSFFSQPRAQHAGIARRLSLRSSENDQLQATGNQAGNSGKQL